MDFLPQDYEVPKSSGLYAKLEDGDNEFIVLGSVVLGWLYWNTNEECIRSKDKPEGTPDDIGVNKRDGKQNKVQHFWAIPVYNIPLKQVQILEVTQKRLMGALQDLARDKNWGDPILKYQITIKKSGKNKDTTFQTLPVPLRCDIEEIKKAYEESEVDMTKYFDKKEKSEATSADIKM